MGHSLVRSVDRSHRSLTCSALLASLAGFAALVRSLASELVGLLDFMSNFQSALNHSGLGRSKHTFTRLNSYTFTYLFPVASVEASSTLFPEVILDFCRE